MKQCAAVTYFMLSCGIGIAHAQPSTANGAFSKEQAAAGEQAYQSHCASCHGTDLSSTDPEFPALTDGPFKFNWLGKTIAEKFEIVRNTMPPRSERSLDDQTYLDVVTYILSFNGIPSGNRITMPGK